MTPRAKSLLLGTILALALVLPIFSGTLKNDFVFDDHHLIQLNPIVRTLNPVIHVTSSFWSRWEKPIHYYRPIVTWSLAIDRAIYGEKAWGFHLTNMLFHAINIFLLFLLLEEIGGRILAIIGATFFAVHPVQVESVAFALGRTDLLCALFLLLTTLLYAHRAYRPMQRNIPFFLLSLLTFSCALFSKESAIVFPALAIAVDMASFKKESWGTAVLQTIRRFLRWMPIYLLILIAYLMIRYSIIGQLLSMPSSVTESWQNPMIEASLTVRWLTAVHVAFRYLVLVFFPRYLSADYGYDAIPLIHSAASPTFLVSLMVLILFGIALWVLARRNSVSLFGALSLIGTYLFVSHLFFPAPTMMAERILYLPMIGLSALIASTLMMLAEIFVSSSRRHVIAIMLAILLMIPLSIRSIFRVSDWRDDLTLFLSATEATPRSALAWNNLGIQQMRREDDQSALRSFQQAIEIYPGYIEARVNYAIALRRSGDLERAESMLRETIEKFPDEVDVQFTLIQILTQRADWLAARQKEEESRSLRQEAIERGRSLAEEKKNKGDYGMEAHLLNMVAQNLALLNKEKEAEGIFHAAMAAADRELAEGDAVPEVSLSLKAGVIGAYGWFLVRTHRPLEAAERFMEAKKTAERARKDSLATRMEIEAGEALLQANKFDAAMAFFHQALERAKDVKIRKKGIKALEKGAEKALELGRFQEAWTIYDWLLKDNPQSIRALHGRARARLGAGDLEGAEQDLKHLSSSVHAPRLAAAIWNDLALISIRRNDPEETLKRLQRSLQFDPEFPEALLRRGQLLEQRGQLQEAEKDLLSALNAGIPDSGAAEAWFLLGRISRKRGDFTTARDRLRRCLAIQPDYTQARTMLKDLTE